MNRLRKYFAQMAKAMLVPVNPSAVLILGVLTFVWGFWVANPWWEVFSHAQVYSVLDNLPEWCVGLLAMTTGAVTCWGAIRGKPPAVYIGAAVAGWYWLMISVCYFVGDWHNTGGIVSLFLSIYCGFIYLNIHVNDRYYRKNNQ